MSNPKDCIHCCDYEDMGCNMSVCEFDFPSINTPKCNGCSKFIKRDLVQVVRCEDCIHYYADPWGYGNCVFEGGVSRRTKTSDFCSWGERRKNR